MKLDMRTTGCVIAIAGASASAQIEFIGEPFDYENSNYLPFFHWVHESGDLYGAEWLGAFPGIRMIQRLDGEISFTPSGEPDLHLSVPVARSHSNRWYFVTALREVQMPHWTDLIGELRLYDAATGENREIDLDYNLAMPRGVDDSGRTIVGSVLNDFPDLGFSRIDPLVYDDTGARTLPVPEPPADRTDWVECGANHISADGSVVLGSVYWDRGAGLAPLTEVILWTDESPQRLPHALAGERVSSVPWAMSADGSVILGGSFRYEFIPGEPGQAGSWIPTERVACRWRDGVLTDIFEHPAGQFIWTESMEIVLIDDLLHDLRVDLEGYPIHQVFGLAPQFSPSQNLMLALLEIDNDLEQQALISLPCSAADVTADHAVSLDDVEAYAARFLSGNPLADLTGDGMLDLSDIVRYIGLYQDGCPG